METTAPSRLRDLPPDERPRERLIRYGAGALSSAELIAVVLRTGTEGDGALDVAEGLLCRVGGVRELAGATLTELSAVRGIGPAKAAQLHAVIELGRRSTATQPVGRTRIRGPRDIWEMLGPELRTERKEHFVAVLLDTRNGVIARQTVSVGDLTSAIVHPREVFAPAIRHGAAALVVAHNHPSGDPAPSPEDIQVTKRLVSTGDLVGIPVMDHVVLGDAGWMSMKESGLI